MNKKEIFGSIIAFLVMIIFYSLIFCYFSVLVLKNKLIESMIRSLISGSIIIGISIILASTKIFNRTKKEVKK